MAAPTWEDVKAYMGQNGTSYAEDDLSAALAAETAAQAKVCRVSGSELPADLREALLRRVTRNLALRRLPLGVLSDVEGGATAIGSTDPEIRRLERPYRKLAIG